jgi:hypothetical protein
MSHNHKSALLLPPGATPPPYQPKISYVGVTDTAGNQIDLPQVAIAAVDTSTIIALATAIAAILSGDDPKEAIQKALESRVDKPAEAPTEEPCSTA